MQHKKSADFTGWGAEGPSSRPLSDTQTRLPAESKSRLNYKATEYKARQINPQQVGTYIQHNKSEDPKKIEGLFLEWIISQPSLKDPRRLANEPGAKVYNEQGFTPAHIAAAQGRLNIFYYLIENGANICAKAENESGATPLQHAIAHNNLTVGREGGSNFPVVQLMVKHLRKTNMLPRINAKDNKAQTALTYAFSGNHAVIANFLLKHGAIYTTSTLLSESMLYKLCMSQKCTKIFFRKLLGLQNHTSIDVNQLTVFGESALSTAVFWNKINIVRELLERMDPALVKARHKITGKNPLMLAAEGVSPDKPLILESLLAAKADVDTRTFLTYRKQANLARLCAHGVNITAAETYNAKSAGDNTVFHLIFKSRTFESFDILAKHAKKTTLTHLNEAGYTPLQILEDRLRKEKSNAEQKKIMAAICKFKEFISNCFKQDILDNIREINYNNFNSKGQLLGKGTFSDVVAGKLPGIEEKVAAKIIKIKKNSKADEQKKKKLFLEEVLMTHIAQHRNIIQVLGISSLTRPFVLYMPKMSMSLAKFVERFKDTMSNGRPLISMPVIYTICKKIASGLAFIHGLPMAHRDLKPENILMSGKGLANVRIADFHLASFWEEDASQRINILGVEIDKLGNANYSAPEIFYPLSNGRKYDPRHGDVWSYGMLAWFLIEKKRPHGNKSIPQISAEAKSRNFKLLKISNSCPKPFEILITKCWGKIRDPKSRIVMTDVLKMFDAFKKKPGARRNPNSVTAQNLSKIME